MLIVLKVVESKPFLTRSKAILLKCICSEEGKWFSSVELSPSSLHPDFLKVILQSSHFLKTENVCQFLKIFLVGPSQTIGLPIISAETLIV